MKILWLAIFAVNIFCTIIYLINLRKYLRLVRLHGKLEVSRYKLRLFSSPEETNRLVKSFFFARLVMHAPDDINARRKFQTVRLLFFVDSVCFLLMIGIAIFGNLASG